MRPLTNITPRFNDRRPQPAGPMAAALATALRAARGRATTTFVAFVTVLTLAALASEPALAQTDVFQSVSDKASTAFQSVRTISFIAGGFGLIAIATMAYFGRFNFKHLAGLIGGLLLVSAAASFISYVTGGNSTGSTAVSFDSSKMGDTFAK